MATWGSFGREVYWLRSGGESINTGVLADGTIIVSSRCIGRNDGEALRRSRWLTSCLQARKYIEVDCNRQIVSQPAVALRHLYSFVILLSAARPSRTLAIPTFSTPYRQIMATELPNSQNPNDAALKAAMKGFDNLFSNDIVGARKEFAADHTPFHWMGLGACAFLQAALGMEVSNFVYLVHI